MLFPESYTFRALPPELWIFESVIHGLGLWTVSDLPEGKVLGISHIPDERFPDGLIRTILGSTVNFSNTNNNCTFKRLNDFFYLIITKDIKNYTELLCNYWEADCASYCGFNESNKPK